MTRDKLMVALWVLGGCALCIPFLGLHAATCGMHVAAVDMMHDPQLRAQWQGDFYHYCKFVSGLLQ